MAVSPDGSRLAVIWIDPKTLGIHGVRLGFGQTNGGFCPGHRIHLGPCLQPGRHAHRHRRRRWP